MTTPNENLKFYLDVEATDLEVGRRDKIFHEGRVTQTPARGSIPQLIQFYGQFGNNGDSLGKHISLDVEEPEYYKNLDLEFTYQDGNKTKTINQAQIDAALSDPDSSLAGKLRARDGEFGISRGSQAALEKLIHSGKVNQTPGMLPLSTMQHGHVMRKILGSHVFEAKYGRDNMIGTQDFISEFLSKMENGASPGQQIEFRAWNVSYDIGIIAQHFDKYGDDAQKEKFKKLFIGVNDNAAPIKIVDEADKLKNIQFELMLKNKEYSTYHVNTRAVEEQLASGETKEAIKSNIAKNIRKNESSTYLLKNQGLRSLANDILDVQSGVLDRSKLEEVFLERAVGTRGAKVLDTDSVEKKLVSAAANMVRELADPAGERDSVEVIRRNLQDVSRTNRSAEIMNRIFDTSGESQGGILGFARDSDISIAEDGSLHRSILKFTNKMATGLDLQAGYSLGTGKGLLDTFTTAKTNYMSLVQDGGAPRVSNELNQFFAAIDEVSNTALDAGGLHDARVDVKNMINMSEKLFNRRTNMAPDVAAFMEMTLQESAINSTTAKLDVYLDADAIGKDVLLRSGVNLDGAPPGQSQVDTSRVVQNGTESLGDAARSVFNKVSNAMNTKAGVLTKAALITSGLALIANTNGDIKAPGSRHNTLEGISPSGDTLLHSFGSGNDPYSNQAINNLTSRLSLGSETLRSSMLGYRGDRLYNMLLGRETFDDYARTSQRGEIVHSVIEQEYMSRGLAQSREHYVYSSELDVVGHIDLVLKSGVPLEIKSVEDFDALQKLKSPKEKHVSQANFYAYALKQPYGIIGYAARNDPTKVKYFKINTDAKRVMEDVSAIRAASADLRRQGHDVVTYSAHKYMSDLYLQLTQNKYEQNAVGQATAVAPGMLASPEDYQGYSAIKALGDYSRFIKKLVWRQERKANLTNISQYKGKSKIRNQGKHADLHGNTALKYRQRQSGYHNQSRAMNYSGA